MTIYEPVTSGNSLLSSGYLLWSLSQQLDFNKKLIEVERPALDCDPALLCFISLPLYNL